ncbi:MAG: hypothetical protein ACLFTH_03965 [Candidatus Woesearchaeota archaeon]
MAVDKNDIISLLKNKGPLVPAEIKSKVGGDTIIVGAILSEQTSKGVIKVSYLKKGGSPFYYLPGQEKQLENHKELLDTKDQQTLEMLKERKVVQDASQELFYRVSLRRLKDFAKELKANTVYGELLFWRYHQVSEQEAIEILRKRYGKREDTVSAEAHTTPQETSAPQDKPSQPNSKEQSTRTQEQEPSQAFEGTTTPTEEYRTQHAQQTRERERKTGTKETSTESSPRKDYSQASRTARASGTQKELSNQEFESTAFYEKAIDYFSRKNIKVLSQAQVAKNREYEFLILVRTDVGKLKMFSRAKSKKKLNEGDVAPALLKAKTKELPCLFLTDGEFTKKSKRLMNTEYKGLLIDHV